MKRFVKCLVGLFVAVGLSLFTVVVRSAEVNGVAMPDTINVEGRTLKLNGLGVRTKTFLGIKVYVAGLYLERSSDRAEAVLASEGIRRIVLQMTHDAPKRRVVAEVSDGVERNAGGRMPALAERLNALLAGLTDLKEGQGLSLTYVPGKGTTLVASGGREVTVAGRELADAIFGAWLGSDPLDGDLKKRLLGGR